MKTVTRSGAMVPPDQPSNPSANWRRGHYHGIGANRATGAQSAVQ